MSPRVAPLLWLWLGAALLFTTVVAPAAFAVLPTRALAGLLVGRVLPYLFWSGAIVGAVTMMTSDGWRRAAAAVVVLASLGAQLGVAPRIDRARASIGPVIEEVPAGDPRRVEFGRLHGISVLLLGIGMLGAAAIAVGGIVRPGVSLRPVSGAPLTSPSPQ
jgi:hypothetical protein